MRGVYIKGMEMPKACYECRMYQADIYYCSAAERDIDIPNSSVGRCSFCPLANVPPHGRLIDADALVDSFDPSDFWNPDAEDNCFAAIHVVNCAPTIIPAEEGET